MSLSNYPDDFPHHELDGCDEQGCEHDCEHDEFELTSEEADTDGKMTLNYICNICGAQGKVVYQIGAIEWTH